MMSLFDDEEIMKMALKSERYEADRATAEKMIKKGKMTLEEITDYVPALPLDELTEIEAEVMQLT